MQEITKKKMRAFTILFLVLFALALVKCVKDEPAGYEHNAGVVPRA